MAPRLILLSLAATSATRSAAFPRGDEDLEPKALAGLAAKASRLPRRATIWTSPAGSAEATSKALGLQAAIEPRLADCDYGRWTGRTLDEVAGSEPQGLSAWLEDPYAAPHGGECFADVIVRVAAWLKDCREVDGPMVAVSHPAVIRAAVVIALGAPYTAFWRLDIAPLAMTELSRGGGRWTLQTLNAVL